MARRQSYATRLKGEEAYERQMKPYLDAGLAHAKAGGDASGIDKYTSLHERNAWLIGWRNGGGDITRKVVVTQRQRWEEEKAELMKRLAWLDERLADTSTTEHT